MRWREVVLGGWMRQNIAHVLSSLLLHKTLLALICVIVNLSGGAGRPPEAEPDARPAGRRRLVVGGCSYAAGRRRLVVGGWS